MSSSVGFDHPFHFGHDHRELPAGIYSIHTEEDIYQGTFGPVYRATFVDFVISESGRSTTRVISPRDLAEALARDRQRSFISELSNENPDRGRAN